MDNKFDREKHVYRNAEFSEILKDAVRFFHGTPVFQIPPPEPFTGAEYTHFTTLARQAFMRNMAKRINRTAYNVPIYVGRLPQLVGVKAEM
jgi:RNase P protein component